MKNKEESVDKSEVHEAEAKCTTQFVKPTILEKEFRDDTNSEKISEELIHKLEIVWLNVIGMTISHLIFFYGLYLIFASANIKTFLWDLFLGYAGGFGVSAGSHRLWSHRSFKATLPMRILLMILQTVAMEDSIYVWARDHRIHHKYTDTNADPYNSKRGFFFSHMGWLMVKKHPDVKKYGNGLDLSDLTSDPVVTFQRKYFLYIMPILNFVIPTLVPMYFWNESFKVAFSLAVTKWIFSLHVVWCGNSVTHTWGYKPYDGRTTATDFPYLALATIGESWHNYHHAFPWDYKVPDIGFYWIHPTARLLEFFALFGLVYDLKTVSPDLAMKQANRSGDGTVKMPTISADIKDSNFSHKSDVWGWDDEELPPDDRNGTEINATSKHD